MRIAKTLSTLLIILGICGLLSSVVQFIVFNDMPPTIVEIIFGSALIIVGVVIRKYIKNRIENDSKK